MNGPTVRRLARPDYLTRSCAAPYSSARHRCESRAEMHDGGFNALRRERAVMNLGAAIGSQDDGGTVLASSTVTVANGRGCFTADCPVA